MKPYLFHLLVLVLLAFPGFAGQETMDLLLNDGSKIKGRVMSVTASEVTVMSDFGVLRLDLQKLTADTRAKLSETSKPDSAALLQRIVELEAKVSQLQQENEQLRRGALAVSTPARTLRTPLRRQREYGACRPDPAQELLHQRHQLHRDGPSALQGNVTTRDAATMDQAVHVVQVTALHVKSAVAEVDKGVGSSLNVTWLDDHRTHFEFLDSRVDLVRARVRRVAVQSSCYSSSGLWWGSVPQRRRSQIRR